MRHRRLVAALGTGLLVSPGQAQTAPELDRIGRAIAAERCARPLEVKVSFVRNPTSVDVADEMQSIACRGLRIAIYRSLAPGPPRELPMEVVLEDKHPRSAAAWSVGATPAQVQAVLGPPRTTRGESFGYALDPTRPDRDRLDFEVRDGVVRALTRSWDVD
jgi:hypothetical protein